MWATGSAAGVSRCSWRPGAGTTVRVAQPADVTSAAAARRRKRARGMKTSVEMAPESLTRCRARENEVCHTEASGSPHLARPHSAPSSAYRGVSSTAEDHSEVCHGSEALHRWSIVLDVDRAPA